MVEAETRMACSAVQFTTVYSRTACTSSPGTAEQRPGYAYDVGWYSKTWMILYDDVIVIEHTTEKLKASKQLLVNDFIIHFHIHSFNIFAHELKYGL